jgi:hypothetical protein
VPIGISATRVPATAQKSIRCIELYYNESVSKSFGTGRLERELQMSQLSATRCSCIAVLCISLVSFAAITLMDTVMNFGFHKRRGIS